MTNTAVQTFNSALCYDLGFMPDPYHDEWLIHESEPVRFVWQDEESLSFELYRFIGAVDSGQLVAKVGGSGVRLSEFKAVVRGFLHG